jgi:hypothetical protein
MSIVQGGTSATYVPTFNLYNNTFYNINHVIYYVVNNYTVNAKNNIFHTIVLYSANGNYANTASTYNNNCMYGAVGYTGSPPANGTGNIIVDPLFVDLANGNFNLRPTSPCVDTGIII